MKTINHAADHTSHVRLEIEELHPHTDNGFRFTPPSANPRYPCRRRYRTDQYRWREVKEDLSSRRERAFGRNEHPTLAEIEACPVMHHLGLLDLDREPNRHSGMESLIGTK